MESSTTRLASPETTRQLHPGMMRWIEIHAVNALGFRRKTRTMKGVNEYILLRAVHCGSGGCFCVLLRSAAIVETHRSPSCGQRC